MDVMTGILLSLIFFLLFPLLFIGQYNHPVEGEGMKEMEGGIFMLATCVFHFIREEENLV